ncbi:uncharacterized protein [Ptychodera flava]|uniref:uncharacterized protein n=1 Tax=Ptychodera flava TaxID=63121 RepID=UPI00396A4BDE
MDHIQTNLNPKPAVLIISDRWGSPFQGGIPAAVRLLAKLFHLLGFAIYCTVLQKSDKEEENANELNVTLVPPKLRGSLEWDETDKPCRKWLHSHASYFENLKDQKILANIKIVVGFALATSEASFIIRDDMFASAMYYITNLWPCDKIPPSILGCSKENLDKLVDMLEESHHKAADVVTSIDHQTFSSFIDTLQTNKHFQILPTPEKKYFSFNPSKVLSSDITYRILSCLEEHDDLKMCAHVDLTKEINSVAENYHAVNKQQLKWVILGVCPAKEDELVNALKPFRHLDIVPKALSLSLSIEKCLFSSHLVLIPPKSPGVNSLHLLISTMAAGIPLLVAMYSPSHDFIKTYFPYYVDNMVVDMETPGKLTEKIQDIFKNYPCSQKNADEIKERFKSEIVALIDNSNHDFISHIKTHFGQLVSSEDSTANMSRISTDIPESETVQAKFQSEDTEEVVEHEPSGKAGMSGDKAPKVPEENPQQNVQNVGQNNGDQMASNDTSGSTDGGDIENNDIDTTSSCTTGKLTIKVDQSGIPKEDNTMIQVSEQFKKLPEVVEETPKQINGMHPGIEIQGHSDGSIIYHVKCTTLDALNYLWHYYTSQKLHKLITSITVTKKTLAIIGAVYLELQVTMDIEEYQQCKLELTCKDNGVPSLLLMEINESKEPLEEYLSQIFRYRKCVKLEGQQCNILQMVVTMTDRVQHILSFGQEILALLGVTRYLTLDVSSEDQTIEALEEQLIKDGRQVQSSSGIAENVSLLGRSLSPYNPITANQVSRDLVEHLLKLWQTVAESKLNLQMTTLQQRLEEGQGQQSFLEKQMQGQQSELEKREKMITELISKKSRRTHADEQISALFVSTIQNTKPSDQKITETFSIISNFCQNRLRDVEVSGIYCTILSHEVSNDLKKAAESINVTLIQAEEQEGSDLPPSVSWLRNHEKYYPTLKKLVDVQHVIGFIPMTKNVTIEIHELLFPHAELHLLPLHITTVTVTAVLFVFTDWNKDELGLTGFHINLVTDFCERTAKAGEDLKAYSTVLDVKISDDQKTDADNCGVTLIPAQITELGDPEDELPELKRLAYHQIYYPDLKELENIQYVIGYAPKTGHAAADIRAKLFPDAMLVLINHVCPEYSCLQTVKSRLQDFEEKMLTMASKADLIFSIGPKIHQYFQNAYRDEVNGRYLSEIPHEEILPRPVSYHLGKDPQKGEIQQHCILTFGQIDTQEALERCDVMAASIGTAANQWKATHANPPMWKIQGAYQQADKNAEKFLCSKMQCPYIKPTLHPGLSAKDLLRSLQQSHLCLPPPWYTDYSFYGLEAMVSGSSTAVYENSHLAHFIMKHFQDHVDNCVVRSPEKNLSVTILKHLQNTRQAFEKARKLQTDIVNKSSDVQMGLDKDVYDQHLKELGEKVKVLPAQLRNKEMEEMMTRLEFYAERM